jgi:hypothetical protein
MKRDAEPDDRWLGYDDEESPFMPTPEYIDAEKARLKAEGIAKAPEKPASHKSRGAYASRRKKPTG